MRLILTRVAAATIAAAAAFPASADCTCRARGVVVHHGQTACIPTPAGVRLARCEKVSNIASWRFLDGACPQASLEGESKLTAAISLAPAGPIILR
jgi:hypothetical protein